MTWRLAESLKVLREQVNLRWSKRSKDSDGSIGDEGHSSRTSDHNPNPDGVVCAIDITHDPKSGCDSYALAEVLRAGRDPRIKYIISNRKIASSDVDPWQWRPYHGANPHDHHVHISVKADRAHYDNTGAWNLDAAPVAVNIPNLVSVVPITLRKGDTGQSVEELQRRLGVRGITVKQDGQFGEATKKGVQQFQSARGLISDGVVGPQTWVALNNLGDGK